MSRGFELDHPGGFASSPWAAAMLGHHHSAASAASVAAAAAAAAQSIGDPLPHGYAHPGHAAAAAAAATAAAANAQVPMDLHMPQTFPYYRYREEALCWADRKPTVDDVSNPTSVNARNTFIYPILELRKEKSRDAARSRRGKENFEFYELAKMLPLPAAITSQLDKASIIRLTISYLKLRDFSGHGDPPWSRDGPPPNKTVKGGPTRSRTSAGIAMEMFEQHQGTHILQSLDGFALALAADGRFLYISETVSIYLGLSQVEMTGSSIFDYIHQQDHSEMAEQLGLGLATGQNLASPSSAGSEEGASSTGTNNPDVSTIMTLAGNPAYKGLDRAFCVRMKSTLTKRGCHFKSSGYRVVLMLCRLRPQYTFSHSRKSPPPLLGMVALAIALPPPSVHEIRLETDMFVTRINFDFRIAHCEPRISELLDYTAEEITGKNLYNLCHGEDANKLRKCHVDLINKGQVLTHYYRIMNKNGGYTWIQTCATVVCNSKNAEEQNIICVNYVISGREYENLIMDCCQLEDNSHSVKREEAGGNDPENGSPDADRGGHNTGGPTNSHTQQDPHRSPPDIDDGSSEDPSDPHGHGGRGHNHIDHVTQLQKHSSSSGSTTSSSKRKRRVRVDSSSTSDDEETEHAAARRSPAVRSSPVLASPKPTTAVTLPEPDTGALASGTSVKDLEHAMSKHLPKATSSPPSNPPTDFSTDALLKQQQRSTIQWIGTHHHLGQGGTGAASAPLPASALLRQLYANRESVIRAATGTATVPVSGVAAAAAAASGTRTTTGTYYTNDVQQMGPGPLPTPPGSEGSSTYSEHQFMLSHHQSYSATSYSMDYHSAMTPPSSVSPRDKHQHGGVHGVPFDQPTPALYSDVVLRHGYGNVDSPAQPLPLKPQPALYSAMHPSALDAYVASASASSPLDHQSQFYHHGSAAAAAGFHLYHPGNKAAPAGPAASANWYSTS